MNKPTLPTAAPTGAPLADDPLAGTPYRFVARLGEGGMGEVVEAEHETLGHRGLSAAHAAGLVHRDLKPDNLFLEHSPSAPPRVKVLDFGIAKIVGHATTLLTPAPLAQPTADGMTVGTARWSSPEQSRGAPDIDAGSDVYSMGWVLRAMLTGEAPFPKLTTHGDLFTAHDTQTPALPSATAPQPISAELDALVMKAIAKRREDRFASAEVFREALARVAGAPGSAGVAASPQAPVAACSTSPTLVATVEQAPVLSAPLPPGHTVAISDVAVARPALPWASPAQRPTMAVTAPRRARRLPAWFLVIVILGVGGTVAAVAIYLWGAAG